MKKASKKSDVLETLFGSSARVRILRFMLGHSDRVFGIAELADKTRSDITDIRREIKILEKIGCVKQKAYVQVTENRRGTVKKKVPGVIMMPGFAYADALRNLISDSVTIRTSEIPKRLASAGKADLIITSGFFMNDAERMADLLIVGNLINRGQAEKIILDIESELGHEIVYALMTTDEFMYRLKMYDKLIRDILDFPHEKLLVRIEHPDMKETASQR